MNEPASIVPNEAEQATLWLDNFEKALRGTDRAALTGLFADESHWRDMLAFNWTVTPHESREAIVDDLLARQPKVNARNFQVAEGRTPPRRIGRIGIDVIESIFSFETDVARCNGVLRLPVEDPSRAWVFSTSLTEIKGHEEPTGARRPTGSAYSRNFGGDNWADLREKEQAFEDREPTVLIIGGSQFGITMGARLGLLGVDTLAIERNPNVGDAWRNRYHSLALHNQVAINHFPYIPYPPNWPKYISKDMLANFVEWYATAMEVNIWTSSTFIEGEFDDEKGVWNALVRREDGTERVFHPKHVIYANGIVGSKKTPDVPGLGDFKGEVLHTEDFHSGEKYKGKHTLVLGVGTSGHDCAQDLHGHGAHVKMIQRGSSCVVSVEAAGFNNFIYYEEDLPIDDADLLGVAPTFSLLERGYQMNVRKMKEHDKALHEGLRERGFKLDFGTNGAGHQMKLRERHGGYYLNCGASELIISGEIDLLQWSDAERFVEDGLLMKDGRVEKADMVVAATGYHNQDYVVRQLMGDGIADKVGQIWGLNEQGELSNMFVPTPQQGLWFLGGGLSQNRVYTRYVALAIKAMELGLVEDRQADDAAS